MHSTLALSLLLLFAASVLSDSVIISYTLTSSAFRQALTSANVDPTTLHHNSVLAISSGNISSQSRQHLESNFPSTQINIANDITGKLANVIPLRTPSYLGERVVSASTTATLTYGNEPTNWNWGLSRISEIPNTFVGGQQLPPFYYPASAGQNVHVWILDSGLNGNNPEFARCQWDAVTILSSGNATDMLNHGTSVASIVCGATFGVAKNAIVHMIKVTNTETNLLASNIIQGIDYVLSHIGTTTNAVAHIMNLSFVFNVFQSPANSVAMIENALAEVVNQNILIVAAAGNDGDDACNWSPARLGLNPANGTMTVGNLGDTDTVDPFSNVGQCVTLYAPGVNVAALHSDGTSGWQSGTSFSAPMTVGAAALYLGRAGGVPDRRPVVTIYHFLNLDSVEAAQVTLLDGTMGPGKALFSGYNVTGVTLDPAINFRN